MPVTFTARCDDAPALRPPEIDTVSELPASAHQLRHLGKARPRRAKSRAPTRPVVGDEPGGLDSGLDAFFPPARSLPSSPLTSPDSESRCGGVGSQGQGGVVARVEDSRGVTVRGRESGSRGRAGRESRTHGRSGTPRTARRLAARPSGAPTGRRSRSPPRSRPSRNPAGQPRPDGNSDDGPPAAPCRLLQNP